jgi:hypothetical protein|uniref:Uncharacterized protein n=1 Tax=Pseudomonas monteilii TaxID=76759 RepID=A0A6B7PVV5_9PSED|nr:hypothetical protein [Pseudomonas monteilii]
MQEMAAAKHLAVIDGPEKQRMLVRFQRTSFFDVLAAR